MSSAPRVLVVEDDRDILSLVTSHLTANGFVPTGFTEPLYALEEFRSDPSIYTAVVSDINMPRMTGIELVKEILRLNPETKVVLMTGYEILDKMLADIPIISAQDVIKKPFRVSEICTRIKKHVEVN